MSKKVVSILFTNYVNDNRVYKMAQSLSQGGFEVTIAATKYGNVETYEKEDLVEVKRMALLTGGSAKGGVFIESIRLIEFMIRMIFGYRKTDIWHCNDFKPFMIGVIGRFFNRNIKLVYDCHELESERNGISRIEKKLVNFFEKKFINKSFVIHVSEGIRDFYEDKYKIERNRSELIYNVPHKAIELKKSNILKEKFSIPDRQKLFIYQGGLMRGRGIETLLEVFKKKTEIHVVFMGYGTLQKDIEMSSKEFDNIHFLEAVPYDEVINYTSSADYGVISVQNICLSYYYCMPNKLFEYIQSEIPVIVNDLHDCRLFVEKNQIGVVSESETEKDWNIAIERLAQIPSSNFSEKLKALKSEFNWQKEELKLLHVFSNLI